MLTTLLNLLRKKAPQTIEIPTEDLIPESGSCSMKRITVWQMDYAAGSVGKMLNEREGKQCPLYYVWPPWLGILSHPGGWGGFGPTAELGWGPHSLAGCPTLNIFKKSTAFNIWLGQESCMSLRPLGISRQRSANFNLSWCWASQLKSPSWECHLLAPNDPQLCTVDPEGISMDGVFARCFGGNSSETQALSQVYSGLIPLYLKAQETNLS